MPLRPIRTEAELWRMYYKPVRRGIRTPEEIEEIFEPTSVNEIKYVQVPEPPFVRIVYEDAEIYSDTAKEMSKWWKHWKDYEAKYQSKKT